MPGSLRGCGGRVGVQCLTKEIKAILSMVVKPGHERPVEFRSLSSFRARVINETSPQAQRVAMPGENMQLKYTHSQETPGLSNRIQPVSSKETTSE